MFIILKLEMNTIDKYIQKFKGLSTSACSWIGLLHQTSATDGSGTIAEEGTEYLFILEAGSHHTLGCLELTV